MKWTGTVSCVMCFPRPQRNSIPSLLMAPTISAEIIIIITDNDANWAQHLYRWTNSQVLSYLDAGWATLGDSIGHSSSRRINHRHESNKPQTGQREILLIGFERKPRRKLIVWETQVTESENSFSETAELQVSLVECVAPFVGHWKIIAVHQDCWTTVKDAFRSAFHHKKMASFVSGFEFRENMNRHLYTQNISISQIISTSCSTRHSSSWPARHPVDSSLVTWRPRVPGGCSNSLELLATFRPECSFTDCISPRTQYCSV